MLKFFKYCMMEDILHHKNLNERHLLLINDNQLYTSILIISKDYLLNSLNK